jgi:hypothetical protein
VVCWLAGVATVAWLRPWRRGVLLGCRCEVGSGRGACRGGDHLLGVEDGGWVRLERGRGLTEREGDRVPRALLFPRLQLQTTKGKRFVKLWTLKEISSRSFPFTWSAVKKRERENKGVA